MTFAAGSMGPKVEAAVDFAERTGKRAAIGTLAEVGELVAGTHGTSVVPVADPVSDPLPCRPGQVAPGRSRKRPTLAESLAGDRHPHRPDLDDGPAVRHGCDGRPAAGRAIPARPSAPACWRCAWAIHGAQISDAAIGGISSAMGAIYILLAVGALIGTWNMAGHDPDDRLLRHRAPPAERVLPQRGGHLRARRAVIGSSWTTAATLGVALVALAPADGCVSGHHRRRRHLGRLLRRQDDAAVRDDRARAVDGRRRDGPAARRAR